VSHLFILYVACSHRGIFHLGYNLSYSELLKLPCRLRVRPRSSKHKWSTSKFKLITWDEWLSTWVKRFLFEDFTYRPNRTLGYPANNPSWKNWSVQFIYQVWYQMALTMNIWCLSNLF